MSYVHRALRHRVSEAFVAASLAVSLAGRLPSLFRSLDLAIQPRALSYTEGVNGVLATRPDIWFQPVAQAPHFPTIYPLGYHALVNVIWGATDASPFVIMHGLGLLSALIGAAVLYKLVEVRADGWHGPAAAAALYALSPAVTGATVMGRVDQFAMALGLLALLAADRRRIGWAIGLTVAAMYVKHSLVVFPIVIALVVWQRYTRLEAAYYATLVATTGLSILVGLNYLTDGQAWTHLVTYNALHPWKFSVLAGQLTWFAYTHLAIVSVLGYALVTARVRFSSGLFAIVAVAFSLLTIGKIGSWVGYFLPVIAAAAWIVGEQISLGSVSWRREARLAVAVVLIVQFTLYAAWAPNMSPEYDREAQRQAIAEVESIGGPILAEDGTVYVGTGVGQVHEPLMMQFVYEYEGYDGDTLASDIQSQRFKRIIVGQSVEDWRPGETSRWDARELEAMQEHYVRVWAEGSYYVYAPRQAASKKS